MQEVSYSYNTEPAEGYVIADVRYERRIMQTLEMLTAWNVLLAYCLLVWIISFNQVLFVNYYLSSITLQVLLIKYYSSNITHQVLLFKYYSSNITHQVLFIKYYSSSIILLIKYYSFLSF